MQPVKATSLSEMIARLKQKQVEYAAMTPEQKAEQDRKNLEAAKLAARAGITVITTTR
jgi:hypothetical protein